MRLLPSLLTGEARRRYATIPMALRARGPWQNLVQGLAGFVNTHRMLLQETAALLDKDTEIGRTRWKGAAMVAQSESSLFYCTGCVLWLSTWCTVRTEG